MQVECTRQALNSCAIRPWSWTHAQLNWCTKVTISHFPDTWEDNRKTRFTFDLDSVFGVPSALLFILAAGVSLTSPRPIISGLAAIPRKLNRIFKHCISIQYHEIQWTAAGQQWLTCGVVSHIRSHGIRSTLGVYHASHTVDSLSIRRPSPHHSTLVHVGIARWPEEGNKSIRVWYCTGMGLLTEALLQPKQN